MRITSKGRYALLLLLNLAEHDDGTYIALKDIAEEENISKKYLEQILPLLSKASLVKSNRGAGGGYMLAKDTSSYTLFEILSVTETTLFVEEEEENPTIKSLTTGMSEALKEYLSSFTLQDLLDKKRENYEFSYCI